jgi:hypothetical protein
MSVDKSVYQAPQGLDALVSAEPDIEIAIDDPEAVEIGMDGLTIELSKEPLRNSEFDANLAEDMDESELQSLASELLGDYEADLESRKEWLTTYIDGLKLLGLKFEERTEPWPGACGVTHPLLMESAVKFQSETIMETFPASGPVRTKIIGKETPDKKQAAIRVEADLNYELTEVMKEYRPEHERMLVTLCLAGNAFKKIYFDPSLNRQTAVFIPAEDIVVPYGASSLESAERVTHRMRRTKNEVRKLQVAGFYRDIDLGEPQRVLDEVEKQKATDQGFTATTDERFQLLEMHVDLVLEGDEDVDEDNNETGIALPYVVTIEKGTQNILSIRRNWLEDDELKAKRQHFVHYGYIPGFGFYYFGLIHLIGGHSRAATSLLRQLVDAGTLSNLPGGLKTRGMRIKGDDTPIAPGEFRDVDVPSGSIRDGILPLPYKEPSQTLSLLMDKIVADGRSFAAVADIEVSDMSAQAPVGTTLAVLERVLKVMSAVQARIHYTMKQEFKLLAKLIRDYTPEDYTYDPEVGGRQAKQEDYDLVDVIPVSDPNASTMAQRVVQYQAVIQLAGTAPQIYDLPFLHRQMIENMGVKNASKIIPSKEDIDPTDPVTENMNIMNGTPVKAFIHQDHQAHMAVHQAMMQDPKIAATLGQNPQAQTIMSALQAHIMEHTAFQYRKDIEAQLGAALPPMKDKDNDEDDAPIPPEVEGYMSQLMAQAAQKVLQQSQAQAAQQQAQQQAQDPLIQMQQQELQIKAQDVQVKAQKAQTDAQAKQSELQLKAQQQKFDQDLKALDLQLRAKTQNATQQAAGTKLGMDIQKHKAEMQADGVKTGLDVQKHHASLISQHVESSTRHGLDLHKHRSGMQSKSLSDNVKSALATRAGAESEPEAKPAKPTKKKDK